MKPGYKTSEFWLTLAAQIIPLLVLLGYLTPEQASGASDAVSNIIKDAFALLASAGPVVIYIWGRAKVKSGHLIEPIALSSSGLTAEIDLKK